MLRPLVFEACRSSGCYAHHGCTHYGCTHYGYTYHGSVLQALYWVQAKDNQPPTDHGDPPDLLAVPAPRGTGGIESLHEQPLELLAPVRSRGQTSVDTALRG